MSSIKITSAKTAQANKMRDEAMKRLKELRQIVKNEITRSGQGTDEIMQLQDGGELHFINTKATRAYYLNHEESWLYLERENDGTSGTLYIVRQLPDGRLITKTMQG
ncbi:Mitogen-activated protein kinase kinase kinase [Dirofilaria immitis]